MDSGNSGSMQSSSGGDDQEFDSSSSFLTAPNNFGGITAPQFLSHQSPNFFDPNLTQSLDHAGGYANANVNDGDLIWSRGLRSENQSVANLGNSARPARPQQVAAAPPPPQQARNLKKRTRASRRAPTTVLTTDTTNFRQMVQEFTGIPAAPFSGGSPYSRRLDLFSAASALRSAVHLDGLGPLYPLRPAAHKILSPFSSSTSAAPPPQFLNSTMIDAIVPTMIANNNNTASTSNVSPNNFQLYQHHSIITPQMNFSNLSGFLNRDGGASASSAAAQHDDLSMWKSGETVRNNDPIQQNLPEFNNNNINSGGSQNYNLNVAEKGMENAASSTAEGTVASWICPSD
ncbi:hypothetical protein SASPL_103102 [Salvia splendens]|uniref:VQ domain-containing protein n=1 Tax=Salvia splendens TaxID=180675 RepID=A0A8X8YSH7_SALSN|nr:uncharacterized protein LOC121792492 [Salvia splendens]KAG6438165.1 hypothetical protein SASPL_103102 [Salvia splendens]